MELNDWFVVIMKWIQNVVSMLLVVSVSGCLSAAIAQTGKKELKYPSSRKEIVKEYGPPILSGRAISRISSVGAVRWEVYSYRGMMRDDDFSNSAGTAGAVTLGVSEAFSLPVVALNRAGSATARHLFLAEYRGGGEVRSFRRLTEGEF